MKVPGYKLLREGCKQLGTNEQHSTKVRQKMWVMKIVRKKIQKEEESYVDFL